MHDNIILLITEKLRNSKHQFDYSYQAKFGGRVELPLTEKLIAPCETASNSNQIKRTNNMLQSPQHKCFQTLAYGGTHVQSRKLRISRAGLAKRRSRCNTPSKRRDQLIAEL